MTHATPSSAALHYRGILDCVSLQAVRIALKLLYGRHATPEAIEQMKAELAEIGGAGVVLYLEGQLDEIEEVGPVPDPI